MALVGEKKQMGGLEIVKELQKDNPTLRFTANKKRNAVAYWAEDLGRWQVILGLRLDGSWGRFPDILVDGKTLIPDSDWDLEINNQQSTINAKGEAQPPAK